MDVTLHFFYNKPSGKSTKDTEVAGFKAEKDLKE